MPEEEEQRKKTETAKEKKQKQNETNSPKQKREEEQQKASQDPGYSTHFCLCLMFARAAQSIDYIGGLVVRTPLHPHPRTSPIPSPLPSVGLIFQNVNYIHVIDHEDRMWLPLWLD